ncbi:epoxide hydrolase 1 [Paramyrothecium foliicola]|nr:epoxide hydrolase 1 [Paramyrothecium foliicola]
MTDALKHFEEIVEDLGPFDGVVGFSQGAALATSYMYDQKTRHGVVPFKFALLFSTVCAFVPDSDFSRDEIEGLGARGIKVTNKSDTSASLSSRERVLYDSLVNIIKPLRDGHALLPDIDLEMYFSNSTTTPRLLVPELLGEKISIPTLHMHGKRDAEFMRSMSLMARGLYDNKMMKTLEHSGTHHPPQKDSEVRTAVRAMEWVIAQSPLAVNSSTPLPAGVQPFRVDLSAGVPDMLAKVRNTALPEEPQYPGVGSTKGIDLAVLNSLRDQWLNDFDWNREQEYLNSFDHFTTVIEGLTLHFIHHKSEDPDAIPILLSHGWPGSFMEFLPVVQELTQASRTSLGKAVSFNVVVPSLPGFDFSEDLPGGWTLDDTARIFNTLMTEVLGYETYAAHGTSNGAILTYTLYDQYNTSTRAAHFPLMPFYPTTIEELRDRKITLSPLEQAIFERSSDWSLNGTGYFLTHIYKPSTIGLGLYDNPLGQLAWMGEKLLDWADPNAGKAAPSLLTHNEILRSVSLTYLTRSFMSSIYVYAQDTDLPYVKYVLDRARTDAPMFVTFFRYSIGFWPEQILRILGNLVQYRLHETGGFFAGLENPPAFVNDLRDIGDHWPN